MTKANLALIACLLAACGQTTPDPNSMQQAATSAVKTNPSDWQQQQLDKFKQEIWQQHGEYLNADLYGSGKTYGIGDLDIQTLTLPNDWVQLSWEGGYFLGHHQTNAAAYRPLDAKNRHIIPVQNILTYDTRGKMTEEMYQALVKYRDYGWRGTPQNEAERRLWLADNMSYVFANGHFVKNESGKLEWHFCTVPTLDNSYQTCASLPDAEQAVNMEAEPKNYL